MTGLFVIIPGFGSPNLNVKLEILKMNLRVIQDYDWKHLKVRICVYDDSPLPSWLTSLDFVDIIREKGIVAEYLIRHAKPEDIDPCYDVIMMLLDDILLLSPFSWHQVLQWKQDLKLDIMSPVLSHDSAHVYKYMLQDTATRPIHTVRIMRVCEFFCYILDPVAYRQFYPHFDEKNPWMWGLDLIMERHLKLRIGLMNTVVMKHFFQGDSYLLRPDVKPTDGYVELLKKYGENGDENLRAQQHTKYVVFHVS